MSGPKVQKLGFWMATALVVGNVIGSGVYMLPGLARALRPRTAWWAWLFTATGALLLAAVFAALSRAFPKDGGPYVYTRAAFGELAGFVVAWGYWVSVWVGNAAIATGAVSYTSAFAPWIARVPGASAVVTIAVVWLLTLVNCWGVRAAGWVQAVTTVLKLLPLLAVALVGGFYVRRENLASFAEAPLTLDGITAAATLALWALLGFESATVPADKVEDPARTIPRATMLGTVVTALVCTLACCTVLLVVPAAQLAASNAPVRGRRPALLGRGRRDARGPLRGHQRLRRPERLDPPAGRAAVRDGPRRRLPAGLRARVGAPHARLRPRHDERRSSRSSCSRTSTGAWRRCSRS